MDTITLRIGSRGDNSYVVPEHFPDIPDNLYELEAVNGDEVELEQFVISTSHETMLYVVDLFDTADGYGNITLTVNSNHDFEFWSPYEDFYLLD